MRRWTVCIAIMIAVFGAAACGGNGEVETEEQADSGASAPGQTAESPVEGGDESEPVACTDPPGDVVNDLAGIEGFEVPKKEPKPVGEDLLGVELVAQEGILNVTFETTDPPEPEKVMWSIRFYGSSAKPEFGIGLVANSKTELAGGLFTKWSGYGWRSQTGGLFSGDINGTTAAVAVPVEELPADPAGMQWFAIGERNMSTAGEIKGSLIDGCPDVKMDGSVPLRKELGKLPDVPTI